MTAVPPALIPIAGALLVPFLSGNLRKAYLLAVSIAALAATLVLTPESAFTVPFLPDHDLVLLHVDSLSLIVGYIFAFIGVIAVLYSMLEERTGHHMAALIQIGGGLGVAFAGDFLSVYVFWELLAATSLALIWYGGREESGAAGMRYLLLHIFGGGCLLGGILLHAAATGSTAVGPVAPGIGSLLLLIGIGVNAAFITLHVWLPDAYPRSSIAGGVILCVFTTKAAIYLLARTFSGAEAVAWMGGLMVIYGVFFALLQNDIRKLLSYHIVSQVGYMVAGVGIGTALGVSGGIAHLFNHILYKALLFMCMGAVIYTTGRHNLTELGGLARRMPVTMIACVIAAAAISGIPGFNGYISKGMVIGAAASLHMTGLEIALLAGAVGTLLSFVKLTYYVFFRENNEIEAGEAPLPMLIAMVVTAFGCILFGVYPALLFAILPIPVDYHPFSAGHLIETGGIILVTAVILLLGWSIFKPKARTIPDLIEAYRLAGRGFLWFCTTSLNRTADALAAAQQYAIAKVSWFAENPIMAIKILTETALMPIARIALPCADAASLEEDLMRTRDEYPGDPARMWSTGYGVLLVSLFFLFYFAVLYLIQ
ncbi:MAG: Na(+)/H(+) antiporter subunit D [Methanomicrobiaceae archaeon]|uniref:Nadh-ubiquinone oxidoreductase chain l n=1 Tax=hydrocarbon metagenome TaxID=938273 RepID=A0A0W8FDP0_9ZZZZ|nr:Na(+)/H(+) antiporter subunit D [Methanomicrobiaceae archaeon]MDD5419179.1 Na(+)/H(+) antiporter subunit D [Methanomicrobiaceae archaeon]